MAMDAPWLIALEERVREATEALRDLRQENADLAEKIRRLEEQLEAAGEPRDEGQEAWQEERNEIRERVETLAGALEELLKEE